MTEYVVNVKVLNAEKLLFQDAPANKCNPFVRFHIHGSNSYYKSETIFENANPVWNEEIEIPVNDPKKSYLSIELLSQELADDILMADQFLVETNQLPMDSKLVAQLDLPLSVKNKPVGILNLEAYVHSVEKTEKNKYTGPVNVKICITEVSAFTKMRDENQNEDSYVTINIEGHGPDEEIKFDLSSHSDSMLDQSYTIASKDPFNDTLIINMKSGGEFLIYNLKQKLSDMCPGRFEQDYSFTNRNGQTLTKGGHLTIQFAISNAETQ